MLNRYRYSYILCVAFSDDKGDRVVAFGYLYNRDLENQMSH